MYFLIKQFNTNTLEIIFHFKKLNEAMDKMKWIEEKLKQDKTLNIATSSINKTRIYLVEAPLIAEIDGNLL